MALSKVQCGKIKKEGRLEAQSCEINIQNLEEHINPARFWRSTIKSSKLSQSTGAFLKVSLFCNEAKKCIKEKEQELSSDES